MWIRNSFLRLSVMAEKFWTNFYLEVLN
jgi:hypothetical protein